MKHDIMARVPYGFHNGIPLFSHPDEYTENYERISADHLVSFHEQGKNPFIDEEMWVEFERSTIMLVEKHGDPHGTVLDVGVGMGRLLSHFPTMQRYGVDISLGYLEIAQSQGIEVCYALIEDLPYKEHSFELIVCTDVLEHVLDLNRCCANILAALKPNGTLIVRVPYREDLGQYLTPDYPYKYVHMRNFDEYSLRLLFERVFPCTLVDMNFSGYLRSDSRLKMDRKWLRVWNRFLPRVARISKPTNAALERMLYHPIAINVVIKKR